MVTVEQALPFVAMLTTVPIHHVVMEWSVTAFAKIHHCAVPNLDTVEPDLNIVM
jgi:hypothetical protein